MIHNVHRRGGGADVVYLSSGILLENMGHDVIYFSFKSDNNYTSNQNEFFVNEPNLINQILNNFYNFEASKKIEKLIKKEKPDIAHLHSFWGGLTPSICLVLKKYKIPIIHTVHDYNLICPDSTATDGHGNICHDCKGKNYYKCVKKRCFKDSYIKTLILAIGLYFRRKFFKPLKVVDGFIFVSSFAYNKHRESIKELNNSNSLVLHNFSNSSTNKLVYSKKKYFLFFGRLSHEKGLETLINAFSNLSSIELKIVGTGPEEEFLKKIAFKNKAKNIEFVGYKSGKDLDLLIANAYFTIVPSEWWENNPMTIIESYSFGVPVIGSRIGGIPEIIVEGKTGYLFNMGNTDELRKIILNAFKMSKEMYLKMSESSYEFCQENFNKNKHGKILIDFYKKFLINK